MPTPSYSRRGLRRLLLVLVVLQLSACGFFDYKPARADILGRWKAEPFDFSSIRLPLSPDFEVTEKALILIIPDGRQEQPISAIEAKGNAVFLGFKSLPLDLTLYFENKDRIYVKLPIVGTKIYYNRILRAI